MQTEVEQVSIICDGCKQAITSVWRGAEWTSCDTKVWLEQSRGTTDGGVVLVTEFDLCPSCFREKLIPALATAEIFPTVTKTDY